jgi:hypothetical protein
MFCSWEMNKEALVKYALVKYKESDGLECGYDILRYATKGVLTVTSGELTDEHLTYWKLVPKLGYAILGLAKAGKLEYKG